MEWIVSVLEKQDYSARADAYGMRAVLTPNKSYNKLKTIIKMPFKTEKYFIHFPLLRSGAEVVNIETHNVTYIS
jgi:hypothetical protein